MGDEPHALPDLCVCLEDSVVGLQTHCQGKQSLGGLQLRRPVAARCVRKDGRQPEASSSSHSHPI